MADLLKFTSRALRELRSRAKSFGTQAVLDSIAGELARTSPKKPTPRERSKSPNTRQLVLAALYHSRSWGRRHSVGARVQIINETFRIIYGERINSLRQAKPGTATQMDLKRILDAAKEDDATDRWIKQIAALLAEKLPQTLLGWEETPMQANKPPNNPPFIILGSASMSVNLQILNYQKFRGWVEAIKREKTV